MKSHEPFICRITRCHYPLYTSWYVSDYEKGYNTGRYRYEKYEDTLIVHLRDHFCINISEGELMGTFEGRNNTIQSAFKEARLPSRRLRLTLLYK